MKTFVDAVLAKEASLDDIDDYIDRWHDSPDMNCTLREYLGFTKKEYEEWLQRGDDVTLARIIKNHK